MRTVIFGKGKVGMATDLTLKTEATFHDPKLGLVVQDFSQFDQAIICVSSLVKEPQDHDDIKSCLALLDDAKFEGTIAVRCTVSPIFLRVAEIQFPYLNIIHFPEFMKQRDNVYLDTPWAVVLGGDENLTKPFAEWLLSCGYGTPEQVHLCTLDESALIKLHQNAGLALKVTFANIMYETCQYYGADYNKVRHGVGADVRVGLAHTEVPGEDGFGFGGHCLPKDLACLNTVARSHGFWDNIIKVNQTMRAKNDR